ncbi:MAG TPA: pyruvate kinase [Candidatus Magasanikbacteria bacterium]|nr:pyruvate kinase [Candidatus Magasanikbacteria bacterium]
MQKRTKIVCTIGPACESEVTLTKMIKAGMNVARLNFSHGIWEWHLATLKKIRKISKKLNEPIAIIQDLQGPKIRVGALPEKGVILKEGKKICFDTSLSTYKNETIPIDYKDLHLYTKKGERMMLDDGRMEVEISKVAGNVITAEVVVGGILTSHKGINLPDSKLAIRALTDKDKEDALFGVKNEVDMMALSFVSSAQDVFDLRFLIEEYERKFKIKRSQPIKIIVKIERYQAVKNIKEILDVADAVMVARGDLGVEIPPQNVPLVQKQLIDECLLIAKPVIVATQMLDSMQNNPRPTRAEVSDVANAVVDHTDAVMLSNETATGKYPVETVAMMTSIIQETEKSVYDDLEVMQYVKKKKKIDEVVSEMSRLLAEKVDAKIILAASITGETGRLISRHRPELPIVVATDNERTMRQLNLSWGVKSFILKPCRTIEELIARSMVYVKKEKLAKKGDKIIVVSGEPVGQAGHVNLLEVREVI